VDAVRRLYRVTGVWPDGSVRVRHYMTKKAAEHRAAVFRNGLPEKHTGYHPEGDEYVPEVPPAVTVTVEASDPITWPTP
jgi:hypothetical protein